MKKLFIFLLIVLGAIIQSPATFAQEEAKPKDGTTLFPFFVDVAGDYEDKAPQEITDLGIYGINYRRNPYFYKSLKDADSFLMDVLPFSNYSIGKKEETKEDGTKIVEYYSTMVDGRPSSLYLIEIPEKGLYVVIKE